MSSFLEKCPFCGADVVFLGNECPSCRADRNCDPGGFATRQQSHVLQVAEEKIRNRPIGRTMDRLLLGALIVCATTLGGSFLGPEDQTVTSMIGCILGVGIVTSGVFRNADELDKLRWWRYWSGDVLGFIISYLALGEAMTSDPEAGPGLTVYFLASLIAFGCGIANVARCDREDKETVVMTMRRLAENATRAGAQISPDRAGDR